MRDLKADFILANPPFKFPTGAASVCAKTYTEPLTCRSFDELIRCGWALAFLNEEIAQWREFRKQCGTTNHTCDGNKAALIYREIPMFLAEAKYLYAAIEKQQSA